MISGNLIGLIINGAFVSCETACTINMSQAMIPSSAIDSGGWQEYVAGIRSWNITVNGNLLLESVGSDIKGMIQTGYINQLPIFASFSTMPQNDIQMSFSGVVLFSQGSISAATSGLANWSATLQGIGELTADYADFNLLIDSLPSEADWPVIVDESGGF